MTKRIVALSTALIAIGVFAPGIANAATINTTATIAIQGAAGNAFGGKVNSPSAQCKSARTVVLRRKSPGSTEFVNVGSDKTPSTGAWSVNTSPVSGAQYRALVASKSLGGGNSCKSAISPTVTARQTTTTIAIGVLGNSFRGAVSSSNTNCVSGRHVTLQRKLTG